VLIRRACNALCSRKADAPPLFGFRQDIALLRFVRLIKF
jgi:hypothetical protein